MKKEIKRCVFVLMACLFLAGCGAKEAVAETQTEASTEAQTEAPTVAETMEEAMEAQGISGESADVQDVEETAESKEAADAKTEEKTDATAKENADAGNAAVEEVPLVTEPIAEIVVTPFDTAKTMYATNAVNVRKGPSTDYEVVGHLAMAQAAEVTGQADTGWYQIVLDGESAFVSHRYLSETKVEIPAPQPAALAAETGQAAPAQPTATVAPAGVIMVGDSRCVQMQAAVGGGGCSWICENSKEYTWFTEIAIPKFDQYVGKGTKVVINMGVNDPEHYNDYVNTINAKAAEWAQRGARTYLVSVNPVWENPYTDQEDVDTFNANVPGMLSGVTWIDTSSWLVTNGYRLVDGLHYDDPTYVNIFNLIMGSL